eukprot:3166325-Pyramimonas_sp.AAC.1
MSCITVLGLYIAVPHSPDDLTPVGINPHDRAESIPANPVVSYSSGTLIVNQISFVIILLTSDSIIGP